MKRINLTESQFSRCLNEYRNDLVFNFDNNGEPYYEKDNWQHYIDFIEKIGRYGTLPQSKMGKDGTMERINKLTAPELLASTDMGDNDSFMYDIATDLMIYIMEYDNGRRLLSDDYQYLYDKCKETVDANSFRPSEMYVSFLEDEIGWYDYPSLYDILSEEGIEKLEDLYYQAMLCKLYEYGFPESLTFDDRGLLYVERSVTIPKYNSTAVGGSSKDFYEYLESKFSGVGECWSWAEGFAESYCPDSFANGSSDIILKGYVDPSNVDWAETIKRNAYDLNYEREIYIGDGNSFVELNRIEYDGKNFLNQPIIVPT